MHSLEPLPRELANRRWVSESVIADRVSEASRTFSEAFFWAIGVKRRLC